jgi:hypothetical protein
MTVHANAALGPAGRLALCQAIESGESFEGGSCRPQRRAGNGPSLVASPPGGKRRGARVRALALRPLLASPPAAAPPEEESILRARRETGLGPGRLAGIVRRARSTIWKVLRRHGRSRLRRSPRQTYRRYEWSRPGALLHVDTAQLTRFARPGHRVTSDRARRSRRRRQGLSARLRRRLLALRLRRAARRRARRDRGRLHAQGDRAPRSARSGPARGGDERQRQLLPLHRVPGRARAVGSPPDLHPALYPALERQGRAFLSDAQARVGLRPHLALFGGALTSSAIFPSLLQPAKAPQLPGRPAADQSRSQRRGQDT